MPGPRRGKPRPPPDRFDEAVAWFRARVPMTKKKWEQLNQRAQKKAFTVAGVAKLDLVNQVWSALDKAIADGETLDEFRQRVLPPLGNAWGGEIPGRIENIFRTNVQMAYNAGRERQLTEPAMLEAFPYWRFSAILDGRETTICHNAHGTVLPASHRWWRTHTPPCHFQCRSGKRPLTKAMALALGITKTPTTIRPLKGFGDPLTEWKPKLKDYPAPLVKVYRAKR